MVLIGWMHSMIILRKKYRNPGPIQEMQILRRAEDKSEKGLRDRKTVIKFPEEFKRIRLT